MIITVDVAPDRKLSRAYAHTSKSASHPPACSYQRVTSRMNCTVALSLLVASKFILGHFSADLGPSLCLEIFRLHTWGIFLLVRNLFYRSTFVGLLSSPEGNRKEVSRISFPKIRRNSRGSVCQNLTESSN